MVGVRQIILEEEFFVKRKIVLLMSIIALLAAGCQKKEEPTKAVAPQAAMQPAAPQPGPQAPFAVAPGSNPHAGLQSQEIPPGVARKGKVVQTMDASSYTYVEVEEKGQKLWLAVMKTAVKKGDIVEFPDGPPMIRFTSKTLNRTFDKIIFAQGLRVVK
jgi:hypothetical protein